MAKRPDTPGRRFSGRSAVPAAATLVAAALLGCGGGVYLGFGLGGPADRPPSVALTASAFEGLPGATVRLIAAATDDFGVDRVSFYRREPNGADTLLGTDFSEPFQLDITLPASPAGTVLRHFARAVDVAGQSADSAAVDITVR
jgi:hypothetical protein